MFFLFNGNLSSVTTIFISTSSCPFLTIRLPLIDLPPGQWLTWQRNFLLLDDPPDYLVSVRPVQRPSVRGQGPAGGLQVQFRRVGHRGSTSRRG